MEIDLAGSVPDPAWPAGIEMRTFRAGDERAFYETHQETFADSWEPIEETYEEWSHWHLQPPAFVPDLWFLAEADSEPAGVAICHPHSGNPAVGWVRILGVRRAWRRRGLGSALLLHALGEFRSRGLSKAGLGVDAESLTGAHRVYERAGMHVAGRFEIYEKALA
jgi:GNAT superfamily N-acetyltransferase